MTQPSQPSNEQINENKHSHTNDLANQAAESGDSLAQEPSAQHSISQQPPTQQSNAVETDYPTNHEALNISLYGYNSGEENVEAYGMQTSGEESVEAYQSQSSDIGADEANGFQASIVNDSTTSADHPAVKTKPIHSELLRYDHADDIYE